MFIIVLVVKVSVIQGMVGRGKAQLPPAVQFIFSLLSMELSFFQQAAKDKQCQVRPLKKHIRGDDPLRVTTS